MNRLPITVTIITLNEEKNLTRALQSVQWAEEILVVDSGSTDKTVEIAKKMGAKVLQNPWSGYGKQKNFAQHQASYDWVLNIDADEEVPAELREEIALSLERANTDRFDIKGYQIPRKTYYLSRWIMHGGWYPNYLVRFSHRNFSHWTEPSVHEELQVNGKVMTFKNPLHHFAFSSIQEQILTNLNFSKLGSIELQKHGQKSSIFRLLFKPAGKFIESYFLKLGFLDGLPGFIIAINAAHSMFLKYSYLIESDLLNADSHHRQ